MNASTNRCHKLHYRLGKAENNACDYATKSVPGLVASYILLFCCAEMMQRHLQLQLHKPQVPIPLQLLSRHNHSSDDLY